jgi:uncharacterized protein YdhG (YjbR/CyaY superfamily)
MANTIITVEDYIAQLPADRVEPMQTLRGICKANIKDAEETISYGMIGYVAPFSLYPNGYHCKPEVELPFISIASQKNFIAVYHMGIYSDLKLMDWFVKEFPKHSSSKMDMGKSCIRFKKTNDIPFALLEKLFQKMQIHDWIKIYQSVLDTRKK